MLNQSDAQEKHIGGRSRTKKTVTFYHNPG
jgi:hypothetical protein